MTSRVVSDEKQAATHSAAMAIIAAEKRKRDEKTARLRTARETAAKAARQHSAKTTKK